MKVLRMITFPMRFGAIRRQTLGGFVPKSFTSIEGHEEKPAGYGFRII